MKIALADARVLADETHPARVLLEDIALEGVGWMTFEGVAHEPVYRKALAMVELMDSAPQLSTAFLGGLSADFRRFVRDHGPRQQLLE